MGNLNLVICGCHKEDNMGINFLTNGAHFKVALL